MAASAVMQQKAHPFPIYAPAHGDIEVRTSSFVPAVGPDGVLFSPRTFFSLTFLATNPIQDLDMQELLEEYTALDDDEMGGLDFLDGTNISDTSKDTAPNNISDVRALSSPPRTHLHQFTHPFIQSTHPPQFDDMEELAGDKKGSGRPTKKARKASGGTGAPRKKSQEQMERRRERNRVLARRTRLRKKFFFESLQKKVMALKRENTKLKGIVKDKLADAAPEVLGSCTAKLPSIVTESMAEASTLLDRSDFNLVKALQMAQQSFVVTDPSLPDNPIVFASQGFLDITGYGMGQVLGRNCRFLQGPDTDPEAVAKIRKALETGADTNVALLNYKADGTPFWNQFFVAPLRDLNDAVVYFVGAQCVIDKPIEQMEKEAAEAAALAAEESGLGDDDYDDDD